MKGECAACRAAQARGIPDYCCLLCTLAYAGLGEAPKTITPEGAVVIDLSAILQTEGGATMIEAEKERSTEEIAEGIKQTGIKMGRLETVHALLQWVADYPDFHLLGRFCGDFLQKCEQLITTP